MQLSSVRDLKREISSKILAPAMAVDGHARAYAAPASSIDKISGRRPPIALGIAGGQGANDYKLAVRLQSRSTQSENYLHNLIARAARDEVDTKFVGRVTKLQVPWYQSRQRPLLIGASVAHFAVTAGTIGAFPMDSNGRRVLLSNNHVLAHENQGSKGDAIIQQGALDGGALPADSIGQLLDFTPLQVASANTIDAAIASIDAGIDVDLSALTGSPPLRGLRPGGAEPDMSVVKIGRTTGLTKGKITAIEVDQIVVDYDIGQLTFDSQIEIESSGTVPFSLGGDSGALVLDDAGNAVGLLFSGTDFGGSNGLGVAYANDLSMVLGALNLKLDV